MNTTTTSRNVIDGFEDLTPEQCIDMAVKHVLRNGRPSVDKDGICCYFGIGCAAAPFLTPLARETLPGTWNHLVAAGYVPANNRHTIADLQRCHDTACLSDFVSEFKSYVQQSFPDLHLPSVDLA